VATFAHGRRGLHNDLVVQRDRSTGDDDARLRARQARQQREHAIETYLIEGARDDEIEDFAVEGVEDVVVTHASNFSPVRAAASSVMKPAVIATSARLKTGNDPRR